MKLFENHLKNFHRTEMKVCNLSDKAIQDISIMLKESQIKLKQIPGLLIDIRVLLITCEPICDFVLSKLPIGRILRILFYSPVYASH